MSEQESVELLNGRKMPLLGLGTWQSSPGQVKEAVLVALEAGYRHIDTAQTYGNEAEIGEALQQAFDEGKVKREDVFITAKLAAAALAPENVRRQTELSLKKLRITYIDLYLVHHPVAVSDEGLERDPQLLFPKYKNGAVRTVFIDHLDTWREMERLVDDGLVRAIGLSNYTLEQTKRVYDAARIKPASLQVECHAWFPQYELLEYCKQRRILFAGYGPIGSPGRPLVSGPITTPLLEDPIVKDLAAKYNKTTAQILLRNLIQRGVAPLPKSINPERIRSNFQIWDFSLTDEDMDRIKSLNKELRLFLFYYFGKQNFLHPYWPFPESLGDYVPGQNMPQLVSSFDEPPPYQKSTPDFNLPPYQKSAPDFNLPAYQKSAPDFNLPSYQASTPDCNLV